jgi:RNA polymerase sigma-70 factor, ECF subfamily
VARLGDPRPAEALVRDTFIALWRGAGGFAGSGERAADWIWALAAGAADAIDPSGAGRDVPALRGAIERRLAIEALAPEHREALLPGFDERLTQRAIARRLALPLGTVKLRSAAALAALAALRDAFELRGLK